MRLADRHDQHGGQRRQHRAEREDARIDLLHRDAEGLRGLRVILRGAHDEADAGARQHQPRRQKQHDGRGDDEQLVAGIAEPGQLDADGKRRGHGARIRAVEGQRRLLEDVEDADGGDDGRLRVVAKPLQHQPVRGECQRADRQGCRDQGRGETERRLAGKARRHAPGDHRAQHEELAMRDVHHPHDAENQRKAERRQRQRRGGDQPLQQGKREMRPETHSAPRRRHHQNGCVV
jgi:hypothetical protein